MGVAPDAVRCYRRESESSVWLCAMDPHVHSVEPQSCAMTIPEGPGTACHLKRLSQQTRWMPLIMNRLEIDLLWLLERWVNTLAFYLLSGGTEELFALKHKGPNILGPGASETAFLEKRCCCISKGLRFSSKQPFIFKKEGGVFIKSFLFWTLWLKGMKWSEVGELSFRSGLSLCIFIFVYIVHIYEFFSYLYYIFLFVQFFSCSI